MTLTLNPTPPTPAEPVTEILHGVPVADPYRWLEDQNSPRTRKWLEQQTAYARAYLDAVPGRERIRKRVEELLAVETVSEPWKVGSRYFYLKQTANQQQPVIMMRERNSGEEIPLVDPAERGEGAATAVRILSISDDGRLLAYSLRRGGEDFCDVEFLDVEQKEVMADRLPRGFCTGLVFSRDGKGFFYAHRALHAVRPHYQAVYWHAFGTQPEQDPEIFFAGEDPKVQLGMFASPDGRTLAYSVVRSCDPPTVAFYIHDLASDNPPRRIVDSLEGAFSPFFVEKKLIALTDWKAPNGRIVAIDLDHPELDSWRELVPESHLRIHGFAIAGGRIFVSYVETAETRIEIFDQAGQRKGIVPCPSKGTARFLAWRPESDTLFCEFTSFFHPPEIWTYHAPSGKQAVWARRQVPVDLSSVEVEQVHFPSKDGTRIPMSLVWQRGRRPGPLPTFLTGYGGFGASITPQFAVYATTLIEEGFLFVVANLRGGSEFGQQWHLAGKRHNRQNAINDFIAAAEWLLANKHTSPGKLAIGGGSNAGLLVGAALTQRPDLFRAVICLGAILDMLRYHKFDLADSWIDEFGSSENSDDFHFLRAYSPYHHVQNGTAYPAVMLISGDADTRCNPMHARKMTARLQAANTSEHPILLDYKPKWGHMPVQPLTARIEALTDRVAFLCHELGVIA